MHRVVRVPATPAVSALAALALAALIMVPLSLPLAVPAAAAQAGTAAPGESLAETAAFAELWAYMESPTNRTYLVAASLGRGAQLRSTEFQVELAGQELTFHWDVRADGWHWGSGPLPSAAFRVRVDAEGAGAMVTAYLAHRNDTQVYEGQQEPDHLGRVMAVLRTMADDLHSGHVAPADPQWSPPLLNLLGSAEYLVAVIDERARFNLNAFLDGQSDVLDLGVLGRFDLATLRYTNLYLEGVMVLCIFGASLWVLGRAHRNWRE